MTKQTNNTLASNVTLSESVSDETLRLFNEMSVGVVKSLTPKTEEKQAKYSETQALSDKHSMQNSQARLMLANVIASEASADIRAMLAQAADMSALQQIKADSAKNRKTVERLINACAAYLDKKRLARPTQRVIQIFRGNSKKTADEIIKQCQFNDKDRNNPSQTMNCVRALHFLGVLSSNSSNLYVQDWKNYSYTWNHKSEYSAKFKALIK